MGRDLRQRRPQGDGFELGILAVAAERVRIVRTALAAGTVGDEHQVELATLGGLRQLAIMLDVETGIRLRVGMSPRSEEHTSELQSLMRISYAVFCLKKKKVTTNNIV